MPEYSLKRLADGMLLPCPGFGTYRLEPGEETRKAVAAALRLGYRHLDTASYYRNEASVGEALAASGLQRSEVFIAGKVWPDDHGYAQTLAACRRTLSLLGLETLDLYLLHWPKPGWKESWRALNTLKEKGLCASIGVCNFTTPHLEQLARLGGAMPVVNQVEFHPFLYQAGLLEYCTERAIAIVGYSPLMRGLTFSHPEVEAVARRVSRTPAQVFLRWALQHGVVPIPKAVAPGRSAENLALFDFSLDAAAMAVLDALGSDRRLCADPNTLLAN